MQLAQLPVTSPSPDQRPAQVERRQISNARAPHTTQCRGYKRSRTGQPVQVRKPASRRMSTVWPTTKGPHFSTIQPVATSGDRVHTQRRHLVQYHGEFVGSVEVPPQGLVDDPPASPASWRSRGPARRHVDEPKGRHLPL